MSTYFRTACLEVSNRHCIVQTFTFYNIQRTYHIDKFYEMLSGRRPLNVTEQRSIGDFGAWYRSHFSR